MNMPDTGALAAHIAAGSFIVNLCALPGPAVPQPPPTELEGLRYFVSRRTRDGNERFYLHVGFFQTRGESERWLDTVRARYPNAFVSRLQTPRSVEPDSPPLDDTQMLRVLEVRAPKRDSESGETGSYAVQSETRVLGTPPDTLEVAAPVHPPVAQATPAKPPVKPDAPKATPAPADVWNAFVTSNIDNDSASTTGVRHLRVEILRPRKPGMKTPKARRP